MWRNLPLALAASLARADFCSDYATRCGETGYGEAYSDCSAQFPALPAGAASSASADTQACREFHLGLAQASASQAVVHCPHASLNGGGVCVDPLAPSPPSVSPSPEPPLPPPTAVTFCSQYASTCTEAPPPYKGMPYSDCLVSMNAMTPGVPGSNAASNTVSCRVSPADDRQPQNA